MKRVTKGALAVLLSAAFAFTSIMPTELAKAETIPEGALVIVEGSNGTIVEADEQLASVTLKNTSDEDVEINEYNLGETTSIRIPAGESVTISAPSIYAEDGDAYKLALIADGTEISLDESSISGDITVCIVEGVEDFYESHGQTTARWIACAIYADENGVDPKHSLLPMVDGVTANANELKDITIVSKNDNTAALRSGGSGSLSVDGVNITLIGDGGDDFTGIGSALGAADTSTLDVKNASIYTEGVLRCAIFAGDEATLNLTESKIQCEPGEYQSDVSISTAGMASPPNGLGIWGNCRAMNMVDYATVNITDCEIISQNWGALGVDDVKDGHLNVKNSKIVIEEQGYGAYSIGKCVDIFDNCTYEINYGVIAFAAAGDGAEIELVNGSTADSPNYYGFVTHQSFNGTNSKITVSGEGTKLHAGLGGIIAKGRGADIVISDGAVVTADSNVLVRAQINDDTGAGEMDGSEVVNVLIQNTTLSGDIVQGMGAEHEDASGDASADSAMPAEMSADNGPMGPMGATDASGDSGPMGPMGPMGPGGPGAGGISITESVMNVTLDAATLTGAITSAKLTLAIDDGNISFDNIKEVGVVSDTEYTANEYAVLNVSLVNGAVWNATEDICHMMTLSIDESSSIVGNVYVDGNLTTVTPGETYAGDIVVTAGVYEAADADTSSESQTASTSTGNPIVIVLFVVILIIAVGGYVMSRRKKEN